MYHEHVRDFRRSGVMNKLQVCHAAVVARVTVPVTAGLLDGLIADVDGHDQLVVL